MNTSRIDSRFHFATAGMFMVLVSSVALSTMTALEAQTLSVPAVQVQTTQQPAQQQAPQLQTSIASTTSRVEQIVVTAKRI
jgi:hypothetical protein